MNKTESRSYNCKDEELPVICMNALVYLKRDFADFAAFSPIFDEHYLERFEQKINLVDELVFPKIETEELKKITKRLYHTMDSLLEPIDKVKGYLLLTKDTIGLSAKDFGLTLLVRKITSRDSEGVRQNLLLVLSFLKKYREQLIAVGLSESIIEQFSAALHSITDDNQLQFDITTKRKAIVHTNLSVLNDLYHQLIDILNIGKSLYNHTNPSKAKEYVFNTLLKGVRNHRNEGLKKKS
jgi:hypothetical protein